MLEIKYIERGLFAGKPMVTSQNGGSFLLGEHKIGLVFFLFMIFAVIIYWQLLWKKTWKC